MKKRSLGQNICSVARVQMDTHESEYRGHPFKVSRCIPLTYHQGSVQKNAGEDQKTRPGNIPEIHINQTVKNNSQS